MIPEEEHRRDIPAVALDISFDLKHELERLYPGYELIYRNDIKQWVLYWVKIKKPAPSEDLLYMQFILPGPPGMWLLATMKEKDRGNETFKEWWEQRKRNMERISNKKIDKLVQLMKDSDDDYNRYKRIFSGPYSARNGR